MADADAMKLARDGTLAYGAKRQPWDGWLWPVVVSVGRDVSGKVVAVDKMFSAASGTVTYGDWEAVAEWERTEQGRIIDEYRRTAGQRAVT